MFKRFDERFVFVVCFKPLFSGIESATMPAPTWNVCFVAFRE
jgi:hypothetical protein